MTQLTSKEPREWRVYLFSPLFYLGMILLAVYCWLAGIEFDISDLPQRKKPLKDKTKRLS